MVEERARKVGEGKKRGGKVSERSGKEVGVEEKEWDGDQMSERKRKEVGKG